MCKPFKVKHGVISDHKQEKKENQDIVSSHRGRNEGSVELY